LNPKHAPFELEFDFNSLENINSDDSNDDATDYDGTIDVYLDIDRRAPQRYGMEVRYGKFNFGSSTGKIQKEFGGLSSALKGIMLLLEDDGTESDSAIDKLLITSPLGNFRGSWTRLQSQTQKQAKVAPNTGYALWLPRQNAPVRANDVQLEAQISSAGTDIEIHYAMIGMLKQ
jgi:hypothetical protein